MSDKARFMFFPGERLSPKFPFSVWLVGSLALSKGALWLFMPNMTPGIFIFPLFIAFGFGIWNFRNWAWWGVLAAVVIELGMYIFLPFSPTVDMQTGLPFESYTRFFNIVIGPAADILIIVFTLSASNLMGKAPGDFGENIQE